MEIRQNLGHKITFFRSKRLKIGDTVTMLIQGFPPSLL